jgi:hypothetical protein
MGERSLLDAFQSAAKQEKDSGLEVLIPFYCFYSGELLSGGIIFF